MKSNLPDSSSGDAPEGFAQFPESMQFNGQDEIRIAVRRDLVKVEVGSCMLSEGVKRAVCHNCLGESIARHIKGDWGDLTDEEKKENDEALAKGTRLLSAYKTPCCERFYVITEQSRPETIVMLPEEVPAD